MPLTKIRHIGPMVELPSEQPAVTGRRDRSRLRTELPASLTTLNGVHGAHLIDLSLTGAKVLVTDRRGITEALRPGQGAVLEWAGYEAFGSLIWAEGDLCGISFEDRLDPNSLLATRDLEDRYAAAGRARSDLMRTTRDWVQGRK